MKIIYGVTPPQPQLYYNFGAMNGYAPPGVLRTDRLLAVGNINNVNIATHAQPFTTYIPLYPNAYSQSYQNVVVSACTPCLLQCPGYMVINTNTSLPFQRTTDNLQGMPYVISNQQNIFLAPATSQARQTPSERFKPRRHDNIYVGPIGRLKKNTNYQATETSSQRGNCSSANKNRQVGNHLAR